jgi:uncharacterized protein YqjF (DUF2071 family)
MSDLRTMRGGMAPSPSATARVRMESGRWDPLFTASWDRVLMIHLEVDPAALGREVPFALDLWDGHAFVTLVAFTMRGMRPVVGGRLGAWFLGPIATHRFLNVRTYVRHGAEPGIHFLAEWLSNRLAVQLGPWTFGLPYRHGRLEYNHDWECDRLEGQVKDAGTGSELRYRARRGEGRTFARCEAGTRLEWLMERYTAYTECRGRHRLFRVWHPPWPQAEVEAELVDCGLLVENWPWMGGGCVVGANYSPGLDGVWMGRPRRLEFG